MMEPNADTKFLVGVVCAFLLIGVLGFRGCGTQTRYSIESERQRNETIRVCLQQGNRPLECAQVR